MFLFVSWITTSVNYKEWWWTILTLHVYSIHVHKYMFYRERERDRLSKFEASSCLWNRCEYTPLIRCLDGTAVWVLAHAEYCIFDWMVCDGMCVYICIYIYTYIHLTHIKLFMFPHECRGSTYLHIHTHVNIYIHTNIYTYIHISRF